MADYIITRTVPTVYVDRSGNPVHGYVVYFDLPEFDETHYLEVPSLDETIVKNAIERLLDQRRKLAQVGGASVKK
jgi:hypothetical protein